MVIVLLAIEVVEAGWRPSLVIAGPTVNPASAAALSATVSAPGASAAVSGAGATATISERGAASGSRPARTTITWSFSSSP